MNSCSWVCAGSYTCTHINTERERNRSILINHIHQHKFDWCVCVYLLQFLKNPEGKSLYTYKILLPLFYLYLVPCNLIHVHKFVLSWETLVKTIFNPSLCQSYLRLHINEGRISSSMNIHGGPIMSQALYYYVERQTVNEPRVRLCPLRGSQSRE